jgi:hypothetical protein
VCTFSARYSATNGEPARSLRYDIKIYLSLHIPVFLVAVDAGLCGAECLQITHLTVELVETIQTLHRQGKPVAGLVECLESAGAGSPWWKRKKMVAVYSSPVHLFVTLPALFMVP